MDFLWDGSHGWTLDWKNGLALLPHKGKSKKGLGIERKLILSLRQERKDRVFKGGGANKGEEQ
jgi:hypothetical protein